MLVYFSEKLLSVMAPVSEFLFSFINVMIMYFFFSFVMSGKKYISYIFATAILALSVLLTGFALYNSFSSPNMLVLCIAAFVFGMTLFHGSIGQKMFYIILYVIVTMIAEISMFILFQLTLSIDNTVNLVLNPGSVDRIVFRCLTKIIIIFILYFIAKRKRELAHIPFKYYWLILVIYASSVIGLIFLFEVSLHIDVSYAKVSQVSVSLTSISIMMSDIFVFIVFELLCKYFNDKQTAALIENQKSLTEKHILQNERNSQEIRKLWHDLGNHLSIIQAYLNENQSSKAASYINEVKAAFEVIPMVIKTGNGIADIVINQKRAIALDKRIKFEVTAYINDYVKITSSDLCVLLSNSLDNAIEASELVTDERKRIISLKVKTHKQFLMIEVENYSDNAPIYLNGSLATRKKDAANHGLGILSMGSIAEKYDGTIEHKYADNIFQLTIMLNI